MRLLPFGRNVERRSLNNPSIPLSADGIISILGQGPTSNAGVSVSETTAMRMSALWRCVNLISGSIAQLPLRVYTRSADGQDRKEVIVPLLQQPYPDYSTFELWEIVMCHLLLWGNAFLLKIPNEASTGIVQLLPLQPWTVDVTREIKDGNPYGPRQYTILNGGGTPLVPNTPKLSSEEILHFSGITYDGIRGLSPIAHMRETIGVGLASEQFAARFYGGGALQSGFIQTDQKLSQEQADNIKLKWRTRNSGLAKAHEVAILEAGLKWIPTSLPPDAAQMIASREFSVNEICRMYGVPPHLVADVEKSTSWGSGIAEQSLGFFRYTLQSWITRIESRVTMELLPPGQFAEFDADILLRGDTAARYASYSVALTSGFMTANEVRKSENMPQGPDTLNQFKPIPEMPAPLPNGAKEPAGA